MDPENTNPNGGEQTQNAENQQTEGNASKAPNTSKKVSFDDEQQAFVDALADKMFGKGFDRGKAQVKELEGKLADATAMIDKLTSQVKAVTTTPAAETKPAQTQAERKEEGTPKPSQDVSQLMAQLDELRGIATSLKSERDDFKTKLESFETTNKETRIKEEFLSAASGFEFFDPAEVLKLVREEIEWDPEYRAVVIKHPRTGQPRMSSSMEPMTLAEYLGEFVKRKPYLVRASGATGGTGAGQSRRIETAEKPEIDAAKINSMSPEEFEAFRDRLLTRS